MRRALIILALLAPAGVSGCGFVHSYRTVNVHVIDAETRQPIAGADVELSYLTMLDPFAPWPSSGRTAPDGIARLRATPFHSIHMRAKAEGYQWEDRSVTSAIIEAINKKEHTQPDVVFEMYAEPRATVELVVPVGYRGVIRTEFVRDEGYGLPGQRQFSYPVPESGIVQVRGPRMLTLTWTQTKARYADGTSLDRFPGEAEVGFCWIQSDGDANFYVVGTKRDEVAGHKLFNKQGADGVWRTDFDGIAAWVEQHRKMAAAEAPPARGN